MKRLLSLANVAAAMLFAATASADSFAAIPPALPSSAGDWTLVSPGGTPPSPRREHCAAYDPVHDRMIVYGGAVNGGNNDGTTWNLDWVPTLTWTQLHPTRSPNALRGMTAFHDPVRNRMVVYGGEIVPNLYTSEVWTLSLDDPTTWIPLNTQGTPPPGRMYAVTVYDPPTDRMIVFSGYPGYNDVWALSLADPPTWTHIIPSAGGSPSARWGSAGVYDPNQGRLVIYSGWPDNGSDTWVLPLHGTPTWQQFPPMSPQPPGLVGSTALYDPNNGVMDIYGGLATSANIADTWVLTLVGTPAWSVLPHGTALPPTRRFHTSVLRTNAAQMIVFGGFDDAGQTFRNDTWGLQLDLGTGEPIITGFAPLGGNSGDGVEISGAHLAQVASVRFNGVDATFSVANDLKLTAVVPVGATTGPISVTSPAGSYTTQTAFFVGFAPTVTSAVPESAKVGAAVEIHGDHLIGVTRVSFGGTSFATFTVTSQTVISAMVDSFAVTGPISVTNPIATATSAFSFRVILPNPRPRLLPARDVPGDEGGQLVLRWEGSDFDTPANHSITAYRIWRRAPLFALQASRQLVPLGLVDGSLASDPRRAQTEFWENLTEIPAAQLSGYASIAPTLSDSTAEDNPFTAFAIEALTSDRSVFYFSNVDSGYSVDNIPPLPPQAFAAVATPAGVALRWRANSEPDVAEYRLYRGGNASFTPGASTLVAANPDTEFFDTQGTSASHYKLAAEDAHGNVSSYASLSASSATIPMLALAIESVRPNPLAGVDLTVALVLPVAAPARLDLIDVSGRLLESRDIGALGIGRHDVKLATASRLRAGIHFIRLTQGKRSVTDRIAVLR